MGTDTRSDVGTDRRTDMGTDVGTNTRLDTRTDVGTDTGTVVGPDTVPAAGETHERSAAGQEGRSLARGWLLPSDYAAGGLSARRGSLAASLRSCTQRSWGWEGHTLQDTAREASVALPGPESCCTLCPLSTLRGTAPRAEGFLVDPTTRGCCCGAWFGLVRALLRPAAPTGQVGTLLPGCALCHQVLRGQAHA